MPESYTALAAGYDSLTEDVNYPELLAYLQSIWHSRRLNPQRILDAACGTGTLSWLLTEDGKDIYAFDKSTDMLTEAAGKNPDSPRRPFFFHADLADFSVIEPVDAAVCMLDSMNYLLKEDDFSSALRCMVESLRPAGLLIFDVRPPQQLQAFDGDVNIDESEDIFCLWRTYYNEETSICTYAMDLFYREGDLWVRQQEEHRERAWDIGWIETQLKAAGFINISVMGDRKLSAPGSAEPRIFFAAERG